MSADSSAKKDTVYARARKHIGDFVFDESVVDVFPDMIRRSVPGYATVISMTGLLAARYARSGTTCYDLGCSLGATTLALGQGVAGTGCRIVAIDNAPAMIESCRAVLAEARLDASVVLRCADIRDVPIERASVVTLNYTLQFVPREERPALLRKIYDGLVPGGVLLLSEKIVFPDPHEQNLISGLHLDFKRANGYSELEISQKRTALENVLIPETLAAHKTRLKNAGFDEATVWFQCLNFASLLAVKRGEGETGTLTPPF